MYFEIGKENKNEVEEMKNSEPNTLGKAAVPKLKRLMRRKFCEENGKWTCVWLTHFMLLVSFYTPWKHQKDQWHEIYFSVVLKEVFAAAHIIYLSVFQADNVCRILLNPLLPGVLFFIPTREAPGSNGLKSIFLLCFTSKSLFCNPLSTNY